MTILKSEMFDLIGMPLNAHAHSVFESHGVTVGVTTVADALELMKEVSGASMVINKAAHAWAVKQAGAIGVVYHVFNPMTGQHTDELTPEAAVARRKQFIEEYLQANIGMFSIIEETVASTGESTTRLLDANTLESLEADPHHQAAIAG